MDRPTMRMITRYHNFQRGQKLEAAGLFGRAAQAYDAAGALKSAAKMRLATGVRFTSADVLKLSEAS